MSSRSRSSISSNSSRDLDPAPGPSLVEIVAGQTGSIVNAAAIVLVAAMMVWFGLRPGLKMLLAQPAAGAATALARSDGADPDLCSAAPDQNLLIASDSGRDEFLEALMARRDNGPERKLLKLVEFDETQAATVLKQWIRQGANG